MTPEIEAADRFVDHMICTWDFGQWEIKALHWLRQLSFRANKVACRIPKYYCLARLANIPENKIAGVLDLLQQKKVLTVTRPITRRGPRRRDTPKDARGDRYAIVTEPSLWNWILIKPRYEDTDDTRALHAWLLKLNPDERAADPKQPELLPVDKEFSEALQEASVDNAQKNLPRHGAAGPDMGGAGRLDRCRPAGDAPTGDAGDNGSRRGSAHMQTSVPEVQACTVAGLITPPLSAPKPAQMAGVTDGASSLQIETSLKGRLSAIPSPEETSLKGRFQQNPSVNTGDLKPPEKGGFNALRVSEVSVSSKLSFDPEVQFDHHETSEAFKEGGSKGETKPPKKGGSVLPALRAPGAKVSYKNEDEFLRERAKPALGDCYASWGGFVRLRYRRNPEVMIHAVDDLIVRLDNPKPVYDRGRWLRSQYMRLEFEYNRIRKQR